jgi:TrmH family RNA methyltransferase
MVPKSQLKIISSLQQKKYRTIHKLFVVEGIKGINEFLKSDFKLHSIYTTDIGLFRNHKESSSLITEAELGKISSFKTPNKALALFETPTPSQVINKGLTLVLDNIRDPGNLGTIIRLCDWFGVTQLVCSLQTVDCFNAKVVQATMGSLTRVSIVYTDIKEYLQQTKAPVFVANMNGANVYKQELPKEGVLIMGNEANGVSPEIEAMASNYISIPRFGELKLTESLNVATAAAILLSEFNRN